MAIREARTPPQDAGLIEKYLDAIWSEIPLDLKARIMLHFPDGLDPIRLALRRTPLSRVEPGPAAERPAETWRPIESAPKDGSAILGFGLHSGPQPDAQRGVKAGDYWWAIMLWDIWRNPDPAGWGEQSLWVFAKDGKPTWSFPSHWMPLPAAPPAAREGK